MFRKECGKKFYRCLAVLVLGMSLTIFLPFAAYGQHYHGGPVTPNTRAYSHGARVYDGRYGHNHYYPAHGYYVRAVPAGHRVFAHGGVNYYYHAGVWYRPWGARFVVVGPPVGIVIPFLPPFYTTVWVGPVPYYYANNVYYSAVPGGYAVVEPPQGQVAMSSPLPPSGQVATSAPLPPSDQVYIYPRQGQDERRQADDKYACHKWAAGQTGFDPTQPPAAGQDGSLIAQKRADYQRAMSACLEGRGYTVK